MEGITQLWHLSKKTSTAAGAEAEKRRTLHHIVSFYLYLGCYIVLRVLLLDDFSMHKRQREKRSSAVMGETIPNEYWRKERKHTHMK